MKELKEQIIEEIKWPKEWPDDAFEELKSWIRVQVPPVHGYHWKKNLKGIVSKIFDNLESTKGSGKSEGGEKID